jgi:hypothetical protein
LGKNPHDDRFKDAPNTFHQRCGTHGSGLPA